MAFVFLQLSGQVLTMLTTPTPALYMDNFSNAAKGKVKAAERAAEKNKKEKRRTRRRRRRRARRKKRR